jgi:histone H3/H4
VIKPQPKPRDEIEELDEESEIEAPELTLPIQEVEGSEEGSTARSPPRLSLPFDDDDITVEYPRRDISIRDQERLSIMSRNFGRPSDVFGDNQSDSDADEGDETGIVEDDGGEDTMISGGDFDRGYVLITFLKFICLWYMKANIHKSGETADLGRFNLVMDFPSPGAMPVEDDMGDNLDETDGFELDAGDIQPVPASPSADENADAIGDFGFDFPPAPSSSVISGIAGGGLRDDGPSVQSKEKKISRHGIPVPNLPKGVDKKLAMRFSGTKAGSKAKINKAALEAIEQASAWYFEQASQDLAAYSKHAGRKTIDESDVATLMRRLVCHSQTQTF